MLGNSILFIISNRLDIIYLGASAGADFTGFYNISKRITRTITDLFVTGAASVSLSALSAVQENKEKQLILYLSKLHIVSFIVFPLFIGLGLISNSLVPLILGQAWKDSIPLLQVLCIYGIVQTITIFTSNLIIASGHSKYLLVNNIYGITILLLALFGLSSFGPIGVAYAFILQSILCLALLLFRVSRLLAISIFTITDKLLPIIAGVCCMGASISILNFIYKGIHQNIILDLTLTVAIGAVSYLIAAYLFMRDSLEEIFKVGKILLDKNTAWR